MAFFKSKTTENFKNNNLKKKQLFFYLKCAPDFETFCKNYNGRLILNQLH